MTCLLLFEVNGYILVASFCSSASRVTLTITNNANPYKAVIRTKYRITA